MTRRRPTALGGEPAFPEGLRFARPLIPPLDVVTARLRDSYERAVLTNGALTQELEERMANRLGVAHVVAVANCTAGLMLTIQALDASRVVLPSFTFSASAHAVAWNGRTPVFAECDPWSLQLDPADADRRLGTEPGGALLATHVFGTPAPIEALTEIADRHGVPCIFDAAHGLGAEHDGRPLGGNGIAEIFSMSPTKLVVAGEGGLVATNDDTFASQVRVGRDYGNPGDYDTLFPGINARLSELHAAMALTSLEMLDDHVATRRALAGRYINGLRDIAGVRTPAIATGDLSSYKDFTIIIDHAFGLDRDALRAALHADGVDTRAYFDPPVHRHRAYAHLPPVDLPVTDGVSSSVLSLPMFGELRVDEVDRVVDVMATIHECADEIGGRSRAHAT